MSVHFLAPEWVDRLPSTNAALLERLRRGEHIPEGYVLAASEQTAGRGRYTRRWVSAPGEGLTFSFVLRPRVVDQRLASLPMATGLGVAALVAEYGMQAQLKWPNDVRIKKKKVAGILAEYSGGAVVVGVGLNVNMKRAWAASIERPATSMRIETGTEYALQSVLERLLYWVAEWIDRWQEAGFAGLKDEWLKHALAVGTPIRVGEGAQQRQGQVAGYGHAGQLLLAEADGQVREIWAGDVSG